MRVGLFTTLNHVWPQPIRFYGQQYRNVKKACVHQLQYQQEACFALAIGYEDHLRLAANLRGVSILLIMELYVTSWSSGSSYDILQTHRGRRPRISLPKVTPPSFVTKLYVITYDFEIVKGRALRTETPYIHPCMNLCAPFLQVPVDDFANWLWKLRVCKK